MTLVCKNFKHGLFQSIEFFQRSDFLKEANEVEKAYIAKFNALFSCLLVKIAKIMPREILSRKIGKSTTDKVQKRSTTSESVT